MALTPLMIATLVLTCCLGIGGIAVTLTCPGYRGIGFAVMDTVICGGVAMSGICAIIKRSTRALRIMIYFEGFQALYGTFWWFFGLFADAVITSEMKPTMKPEDRESYDKALGPAYLWLAEWFLHSILSAVAAVLYYMVRKQFVHELALATQEQQEGASTVARWETRRIPRDTRWIPTRTDLTPKTNHRTSNPARQPSLCRKSLPSDYRTIRYLTPLLQYTLLYFVPKSANSQL